MSYNSNQIFLRYLTILFIIEKSLKLLFIFALLIPKINFNSKFSLRVYNQTRNS
jgi:hypothetical protein